MCGTNVLLGMIKTLWKVFHQKLSNYSTPYRPNLVILGSSLKMLTPAAEISANWPNGWGQGRKFSGILKYFRTKFGVSRMNTKKDTKFGKIVFKKSTYFFKKNCAHRKKTQTILFEFQFLRMGEYQCWLFFLKKVPHNSCF